MRLFPKSNGAFRIKTQSCQTQSFVIYVTGIVKTDSRSITKLLFMFVVQNKTCNSLMIIFS